MINSKKQVSGEKSTRERTGEKSAFSADFLLESERLRAYRSPVFTFNHRFPREKVEWMVEKIRKLRIFSDENDKTNCP